MRLWKTLPLTSGDKDVRAVAACSYLGLLLLPALYAAREDDYIAFHANQGLTLLLAEAVYALLLLAAGRVGFLLLPWGYYRRWTLLPHWAALAPLPFCLLGAFHAMRGRAVTMPIIGWIRLLRSSPKLKENA